MNCCCSSMLPAMPRMSTKRRIDAAVKTSVMSFGQRSAVCYECQPTTRETSRTGRLLTILCRCSNKRCDAAPVRAGCDTVDANRRGAERLDASVSDDNETLLQLMLPTMPPMGRLPRRSCVYCGTCPCAHDASAISYEPIELASRGGPRTHSRGELNR